jgi:hypothetical protein
MGAVATLVRGPKVALGPLFMRGFLGRMRGGPPFSPGDVVVTDYRLPPFYKGETLIVDEVKNIGTRANPYWRAHLRSQRGVRGWLDTTSLIPL